MPSCLGIYIENNLIKYAKISKEHDNVKIESFGIKFYDDIEQTIKQIINETYSFKTPISINLGEENYTYAQVFSLLNKSDIEKSADTEFDFFCNEKGKNKNALQYRKMFIKNQDNPDRLNTLYVYTEKSNIVSKLQTLDGTLISGIYPESVAIMSLNNFSSKGNSIIINIEKETTISTIVNGDLYRIDTLSDGMGKILDIIKEKENSYAKAYEICKNTTLYTIEALELQTDVTSEYIEDIIPTLYNIIQGTKEIIAKNGITIQNVYITGTAGIINNIDLYFQESFNDKKCEVLKPFFLENVNLKINIKDYIEVNSAVALALKSISNTNKEMNFKKESIFEKISTVSKIEIGKPSKKIKKQEKEKTKKSINFNMNLRGPLDIIDKNLIRGIIFALIIIIIYVIFSKIIINKINSKQEEINNTIQDTTAKTEEIGNTSKIVNARNSEYESIFAKIQENNEHLAQENARKKSIPTFLRKLMYNVPKELQVLSIKNTTGKHIVIEARAQKYDNLGYLKAALKTEDILTNVTSTFGTKTDGWVYVTLEGDLPY